jgi:small subunit ribosomal protein S7
MRGKRAPKRELKPDAIYGNQVVSKLINMVMQDGKKGVATKIVYAAMEDLAQKTGEQPVEILDKALENIRPKVEVRARRVGGANYLVPSPVTIERQNTLAMRWLVAAIRNNRGRRETWQVLSDELQAALKGEGNAIKKRQETERTAEANKAFAQFASAA